MEVKGKHAAALLLHFSNEKLWQLKGYHTLLAHNREDLLGKLLRRYRFHLTKENWIHLLTCTGNKDHNNISGHPLKKLFNKVFCSNKGNKKYNSALIFEHCPDSRLNEFSPSDWKNLLLSDPDFYTKNKKAKAFLSNQEIISPEDWIKYTCSHNHKLRHEHFPKDIKLNGWQVNQMLEQPDPILSIVEKNMKGNTDATK